MEYPIIRKEEVIGQVWGTEACGQIELRAFCPLEEGWIYRLYLGTASVPRQLYLGIMVPEGRRFVLRKKLHKSKCGILSGEDAVIGMVVCHRPGEPEPPQEILTQAEPKKLGPIPVPLSAFQIVEEGEDFVSHIFARCGGCYAGGRDRQYYIASAEIGGELGPSPFFSLLTLVEGEGKNWWGLVVDEKGQLQSLEPETPE